MADESPAFLLCKRQPFPFTADPGLSYGAARVAVPDRPERKDCMYVVVNYSLAYFAPFHLILPLVLAHMNDFRLQKARKLEKFAEMRMKIDGHCDRGSSFRQLFCLVFSTANVRFSMQAPALHPIVSN